MSLSPITINDFQTGLQKDKESFLLVNDAFPVMENVYNWRGRIKKRSGFQKLGGISNKSGRLRREITATAAGTVDMSSSPTALYNIFTALGISVTEPDATVELAGLTNIQVTVQGTAVDSVLDITTSTQTFTVTTAGTSDITGATLDYATGDITLTHTINDLAAATVTLTLAYYPSLPVMNIFTRNVAAINAEDTIAFDTKYCYRFNNASDDFQEWIPGTTWSGSNADFFMSTNYYQDATDLDLFWITNFSGTSGDPMRYTNGATWTDFLPTINGANEFHQCRFFVPYKGRLLGFNTWEGGSLATSIQYPQRLRYSQNGDPTDQTNGWLDDTAGRGGFIDCPTNEHIIAFGFLRDQLIIGMERTIWAVRYTGNEILPFIWEKINSEFGWESMRSPVQFDQGVIGIGESAITVCDGVNVLRVDEEIPDEVFNFHNENEGITRIEGIRDFNQELVYWCYPDSTTNGTYPDRILVHNYRNKGWAIFKDSFTCFGIWQRFTDVTWADLAGITWEEYNKKWNAGFSQSQFPNIVAGNQQGYVLVLNQKTTNDPSLFIKGLTAGTPVSLNVVSHNLEAGDYVKISGVIGTASTELNDQVAAINYVDADNFTLIDVTLTAGFTYFGGGEVEKLQNFKLKSKKFNVLEAGQSLNLSYIDFHMNKTDAGEFTCNIYSDYDDTNPINDGSDSFYNTIVETTGTDHELEDSTKTYYRFFCNNHSRFSQFELTLSDAQMIDDSINSSEVLIHNIVLWAKTGGRATS